MSDIVKAAAWTRLVDAATDFAAGRTKEQGQTLSNAAKAWATVCDADVKPKAAPLGLTFPNYGRSKGLPVAGASKGDLEFYRNGCVRTLEDPSKARWHDKEKQLLAAIDAELGNEAF